MDFYQNIETRIGEIWIVNAVENGFVKSEMESRQEFEAHVLNEVIHETIGDVELDHRSNGAPYIKNQPNLVVSISHSENWFALYASKEPVGVDIELNSNQIKKTKNHFLSESEIERLQPNLAELQISWGIKESVYKYFQGDLKSLRNDVEIISIDQEEAMVEYKNQSIKLKFEQSEVFTLVYTD